MLGRIMIVEDEPIVALDLQQELEQFGCEVVATAQSADEALLAAEEFKPDLALMDLHIVGSLDGVQTARLLREVYQIPSLFLTAYSDDTTITRAVREMPYGYLTKPFRTRELKATIGVALHKAQVDAGLRNSNGRMSSSIDGMREALIKVSLNGQVEFINASAERLLGCSIQDAVGRPVENLFVLTSAREKPSPIPAANQAANSVEEFGWTLNREGRESVCVDLAVSPVSDPTGEPLGYILTLREAKERIRSQVLDETFNASDMFDMAPMAAVQLDSNGHILRVNQALLDEAGVPMESLVGRTLTGLSMDPDPRIANLLMHKLLASSTTVATSKTAMNH